MTIMKTQMMMNSYIKQSINQTEFIRLLLIIAYNMAIRNPKIFIISKKKFKELMKPNGLIVEVNLNTIKV